MELGGPKEGGSEEGGRPNAVGVGIASDDIFVLEKTNTMYKASEFAPHVVKGRAAGWTMDCPGLGETTEHVRVAIHP